MAKKPKHREREPLDERLALARWLGQEYADEATQLTPVAAAQPGRNEHKAVLDPLTLAFYERRAQGRSYKLAIGRRVLDPHFVRFQSLIDRSKRSAVDLEMNVHRVPTILSIRHTTMYEPGRADTLLQSARDTDDYDDLRGFSENPLPMTGAIDMRHTGTLVEVAFKLDELADGSEDLFTERALVRDVAQEVPIDSRDRIYPIHIPLITVSGTQADEFLEATSQWWQEFDASEIALSSLGLIPMYRVNSGPSRPVPVS